MRYGDGRKTGLPRSAFDLVTWRLVLVYVPHPEELVAGGRDDEAGGTVALHEAVWPVSTYDPPLDEWDRLYDIVQSYADLLF